MSPGGPPSPPRRRRPRPPRGAAAPGTAAPRDAPRPRAWHGPARPGSGPPDLAFRPSGRRGSRAAGRGATGKATRAPWHPSLRFSPRFPSIVPFLPPPPPPQTPCLALPESQPREFPLPAVRVPLPSGLGEGQQGASGSGQGRVGLQSRPFYCGSEALRMLEDRSLEQCWAPEPAGAGELLPHPGTAWATRARRVGRAADGETAGRFLPQGLPGLASFQAACKGHRPHCCSGSFGGKKMGWDGVGASQSQPQQPTVSREKRSKSLSWSRRLKKCSDPQGWEGWELSHCLGSRH